MKNSDMQIPLTASSEKYWRWGPLGTASLLIYLIVLTQSNESLFLWFNRLSLYTGDTFWACLTICGDGLVCIVLLFPFIRRRPDITRTALLSLFLTFLMVHALKFLFAVPRPPVVLNPQTFHVIGAVRVWGAFPSGHTANIFMLAGVFNTADFGARTSCPPLLSGQDARAPMRLMFLSLAAVVGISRMVVGVHWPLDILGGAIIGWLAAWIGNMLTRDHSWDFRPIGQRIVEIVLLTATLTLLLFYDSGYPQSLIFQRFIAILCLILGGMAYVPHQKNKT